MFFDQFRTHSLSEAGRINTIDKMDYHLGEIFQSRNGYIPMLQEFFHGEDQLNYLYLFLNKCRVLDDVYCHIGTKGDQNGNEHSRIIITLLFGNGEKLTGKLGSGEISVQLP